VAEAYRNWRDLSREEVVGMLRNVSRYAAKHGL
jgi:predicted phosphoribosyltransferase